MIQPSNKFQEPSQFHGHNMFNALIALYHILGKLGINTLKSKFCRIYKISIFIEMSKSYM